MTPRPPLDVNVAYVEGRDEVDRGTSNQPLTQKEKRREWRYGRMKVKRLTPIAVPSKETALLGDGEDEEQRKNDLSVKENSAAIRIQAAFRGHLEVAVKKFLDQDFSGAALDEFKRE